MAGYPISKSDLDNKMGRLILAVRDDLKACVDFKALLDDTTILPDATLTSLGYSSTEISTIRAAFTAMSNLNNISHGQGTQASVNDFFFDAKHLTGIN
jgi:hypothetical protein